MVIKRQLHNIVRAVLLILVMNAAFLGFMTVTFMIPSEGKVHMHLEESMEQWARDTQEPLFFDNRIVWSDLNSDLIWANMASVSAEHPLHAAIEMPWKQTSADGEDKMMQYLIAAMYYPDDPGTFTVSYSRYWMLSEGILRILLYFCNIGEIRYLYWITAAALILFLITSVHGLLGWRGSLPLATAILARSWLLHTACLSTSADIFLTLAAMLVLVLKRSRQSAVIPMPDERCHAGTADAGAGRQSTGLSKFDMDRLRDTGGIWTIFLVTGMFSCALGPLVAPLLTLGMPLLLELVLFHERDERRETWFHVIGYSAAWAIGYVSAMVCKAILAQLVLGSQSASDMFGYYLGPGQGITERLSRIGYCFERLFAPANVKAPVFVLLVAILTVLLIRRHERFPVMWATLFVSLYPIAWIFIVVEHSKHNFASNILSILVYGLLTVLCSSIGQNHECDRTGQKCRCKIGENER